MHIYVYIHGSSGNARTVLAQDVSQDMGVRPERPSFVLGQHVVGLVVAQYRGWHLDALGHPERAMRRIPSACMRRCGPHLHARRKASLGRQSPGVLLDSPTRLAPICWSASVAESGHER